MMQRKTGAMATSGAKLAGQLTCRTKMAETKTPRTNQSSKSKMRKAEEKLMVGKINDGEHQCEQQKISQPSNTNWASIF
jgi:hypothetical protein